jgi:YVTN family beta-propeller protein
MHLRPLTWLDPAATFRGRHRGPLRGASRIGLLILLLAILGASTVGNADAAAAAATATVGSAPLGVAVDAVNNTVYVANSASSTVSVIDLATCDAASQSDCTPVATATVGTLPSAVAVDDNADTVYVANSASSTVSVIDLATCFAGNTSGCTPVATATVGGGPADVAVDGNTVYVANSGSGTVSVINAGTCSGDNQSSCNPVATVTVGGSPQGLAVDTATGTLYVTDFESGAVSVIDGATCDAVNQSNCTAVASVSVGNGPEGVAVEATTNTIYVANSGSGTVSLIDGASCDAADQSNCTSVASLSVGRSPGGVAVDTTSDTIYVANLGSGTVSVIDGATCNALQGGCDSAPRTVTVGSEPASVGIEPATSSAPDSVYVANSGSNTVSIFGQPSPPNAVSASLDKGTTTVSWSAPASDGQLAVTTYEVVPSPACSSCSGLTTSATSTTVSGLTDGTTYTFAVIADNAAGPSPTSASSNPVTPPGSVSVGGHPSSVALDPSTDTVYVAAAGSDGLSVIDAATCNAANQDNCVPVATPAFDGAGHAGVAVNPATNTIYVTSPNAGAVSAIDGATCDAADQSDCVWVGHYVVNGSFPTGVAVNATTNTVYVTNEGSGTVSVIDGASCDSASQSNCGALASAPVGGGTIGVAVDATTNTIYVTNWESGTVSVIDGDTCDAADQSGCTPVASADLISEADGIAVNPTTNTVYVASEDTTTLSVINGATCDAADQSGCTPVGNAAVGRYPTGVVVDAATNTVYAADAGSDTVSVIEGANCDAASQSGCTLAPENISVGSDPDALDLDPATPSSQDTVYVANGLSNTVSIFGEPSVPSAVSASAGNGNAEVSWSAPASDGQLGVSSYEVVPSPACSSCGGLTTSGTSTTVTGLCTGGTYTFTVTATNTAGPSPASPPTPPVTPKAVPCAPASVSARAGSTSTPGDGEADLAWQPAATSGSPVTAYSVRPSPACPTCKGLTTTGATSTTVTGLMPGTHYTFAVTATNALGTGAASSASAPIVTTTVPGTPKIHNPTETPNARVVLSFVPSTTRSGLASYGYEVATTPTCPTCRGLVTTATSTIVTGLTKGVRYSFSVRENDADGYGPASAVTAPVSVQIEQGYWLATATGAVFGAGAARSLGGVSGKATDPAVGIAGTADGRGYVIVTRNGTVAARGDASFHGDLPSIGVKVSDIVAIAETADGRGYWLLGADGGFFAFGDAKYRGSVPGLGERVSDVVAMISAPSGVGYWMGAADGTVWAFGSALFRGDLPKLGVRVRDIRSMLPSGTGQGYVLVGSDGGAFVFGAGVHYFGSLPGRGIKVGDIVGLALAPDDEGYFMAGANGVVYGFGDSAVQNTPAGLVSHLPVVAIAGM